MGKESDKVDAGNAQLDIGADTIPLDARSFARRKRFRNSVRWISMVLFGIVALIIGIHIAWAYDHMRPVFKVDSGLEISNDGLIDWDDLGLARQFRVVEINKTPVSTRSEFFEAIDGRAGAYAEIIVADSLDSAVRRRYFYRDVSAYPVIEVSNDLVVGKSEIFDPIELGLPPGTRVTAFEGEPVGSKAEFLEKLSGNYGRTLRLTMVPPPDLGPSVEVIFHVLLWNISFTLYAVGLVFGLLGCGVFWLKPDTRSSWGFLLFCLHVGLFWLFRSVPIDFRLPVERLTFFLLQCFLPAATVGFLLTFSPIRMVMQRPKRYFAIAVVFGVCLIVAEFYFNPRSFGHLALNGERFTVWALAMLVLILVTLPIDLLFWIRKIPLGATDRTRARIIRLATVFGFLPTTAFTIFWFRSIGSTSNIRILFELSVLLFPLIIGYAIVRHNLLQINELLYEALIYTLMLSGLGGAYMVITGAIGPALEGLIPGSAGILRPALVAGVAVVVLPVHHRMRTTLARRFRRQDYDYAALDDIIDDAARMAVSYDDFSKQVVPKLRKLIDATSVSFLIHNPGRLDWSIGDSSPKIEKEGWLDDCRLLLNGLVNRRRTVYRDEVLEDLDSDDMRWSLVVAMHTLRASVVFPLVAQGRIMGALAIGDKENSRNYTHDQFKALEHVSRQAALVISKLMTRPASGRSGRIIDLYPNYPTSIGTYEVRDFIGEGGMSYVYLARRDGLDYAIKVANHQVQADATLLKRFQREAEAMQKLSHPNIARILDIGSDGNEPFIAIEYFPGGSLDDYMKQNGLPDETKALGLIVQVARGLDAAYERGIIHRDIKPKNLFLHVDGTIKIGDFGLARLSGDITITQSGQIFGTPQYMGPEIFQGMRATRQTDQYALGVTLYELLTGSRPFEGATMEALIYAHLSSPVPDVRRERKDISVETAKIVKRMMAKNPDDRYESYGELIEALDGAMRQDRLK